jgi:hypothetical protein
MKDRKDVQELMSQLLEGVTLMRTDYSPAVRAKVRALGTMPYRNSPSVWVRQSYTPKMSTGNFCLVL